MAGQHDSKSNPAGSSELNAPQMNRPDSGDRALPLCYGDRIMLSCQFDEGVGYLCEEGCVMKCVDDIGMDASSRELVFEVCTAADSRALLEYQAHIRKHGKHENDHRLKYLATQKDTEEHGNKSHEHHMEGRMVTYGDTIQLRQPKSDGSLGVDIGQAPREEPTAKKIVLHTNRGRPVAFRIMPRFKFLVEGHTVCHADRIVLMSTEFPGEYVHAHVGFEKKAIGLVHEVHLSTNSSTAWAIDSFFEFARKSSNHVSVGDVVRLYHPFHRAYVAVNKGKEDATVFLEPTSGALCSTMWVIRDENALAGGIVQVHRSYSLMHLVTRKQLSVNAGEVLEPALCVQDAQTHDGHATSRYFSAVTCIKGTDSMMESMMTLEPLLDDPKDHQLKWGGRVRLLHTHSRQYLHSMRAFQLKASGRNLKEAGAAVEGDAAAGVASPSTVAARAPVAERVMVASAALFREDCFDVVKVGTEEVRAVDALADSLPLLEEYLLLLKEVTEEAHVDLAAAFPQHRVLDVIRKLTDLQAYVYTSGYTAETTADGPANSSQDNGQANDLAQPLEYCQNFMRDLGLGELLMSMLRESCKIFYMQVDFYIQADVKRRRVDNEIDAASSFQSKLSVMTVEEEEMIEEEAKLREVLAKSENRTGALVCRMCYKVLYHMVHRHVVNSNYIARYLSEIQEQLVLQLGAEELLLEILADNEVLLDTIASDSTKHKHVTFHFQALADHGKDAMHLRFLSSMCAVGDRGINRIQDLVLPHLLANERRILLEFDLFNKGTELRLRDWYANMRRDKDGDDLRGDGIPLGNVCSGAQRPGEHGARMKRVLDYFVESLLLLATLCKADTGGRREFVVLKVRNLLSLKNCIVCLEQEQLPDHLRRNMCEFIRIVYVQDDTFNKVTRHAGVSVWNDLEASQKLPVIAAANVGTSRSDAKAQGDSHTDQSASGTGHTSTMQELKNIIEEYLSKNTCQYYPGRTSHSNALKLSMIRLCRELVLFGHYADSELQSIVKEAIAILDFSSMRFIDESQNDSLGTLSSSKEAGGDASDLSIMLTEDTISLALKHLRPLCHDIPPMELARFRKAFKCRVLEAGESLVNAGAPASDMFVIQSGSAFMIQLDDGVESVVDNLGAGEVYGIDTISKSRTTSKTWPFRVRCSQKVIALHLSATEFHRVWSEILERGFVAMTDGLEVVLETKREACALINDVYDRRLAMRTAKMLQEYRFDLNISNKKYKRIDLTSRNADSAIDTSSIMIKFKYKQDSDEDEIPQDFYLEDDVRVLGPLSSRFTPMQTCFFGVRIDRSVLVIAVLQYILASAINIILAIRLKEVIESSKTVAVGASGSVGVHPGLSHNVAAIVINLAMTLAWSLSQLAVAWSAVSHWPGEYKIGAVVLYKTKSIGARVGYLFQLLYLLFWIGNTSAGVVGALIAFTNKVDGAAGMILTQVLWLTVCSGVGAYNVLAFASLYVHLERPALFVQDEKQEEEKGMLVQGEQVPPPPRREFLKILELLDLDENGLLSRSLADLIISAYQPLVIDAFNLLVRTHQSHKELHSQLVKMLILDQDMVEDPGGLNQLTDELTKSMLAVANAMQSYVVERATQSIRDNQKKQDSQRMETMFLKHSNKDERLKIIEMENLKEEDRVRKLHQDQDAEQNNKYGEAIKEMQPLLNQLKYVLKDDKHRETELLHRRLFQRKNMHDIILRLLRCLPADLIETIGPLCYEVLARLCDDEPNIQMQLAGDIKVFTSHLECIPHHVALLLTAIYKDNVELCYSVDEEMISRTVMLMKDDLDPSYLLLLNVLITPKDQTVRRNQNLITKHLDYRDVELLLFAGVEGRKLRRNFLSDLDSNGKVIGQVCAGKSAKAQNHLLCYLRSIDLLTACMAELNHDNKKRCRGGNPNLTLSLSDLEADLYDREVPVSVKSSLVSYLKQAYILVDSQNCTLLMQPEMCSIFDHLARWSELLGQDTNGSRVTRLTKAERRLLTDKYMSAAKAFFTSLPASDLRQSDSARLRVAGRLLEALVDLVLSTRGEKPETPDNEKTAGDARNQALPPCDLKGDEELRVLDLIIILAKAISQSFERYNFLKGLQMDGKEEGENKLKEVLLDCALTLTQEEKDEKKSMKDNDKCQRELLLERAAHDAETEKLKLDLTVGEGVVVFGNDFLSSMSAGSGGSSNASNASNASKPPGPGTKSSNRSRDFEELCNCFLEAKQVAQARSKGMGMGVDGGDEEVMPVSDLHMTSLVELLTSASSLTTDMQATGLAIVRETIDMVGEDYFEEEVAEDKDNREWVHTGVPAMVMQLITDTRSKDSIVLQCLLIANAWLERGKKKAQRAFYKLMTEKESKVPLFHKLRERLVRAERGLSLLHTTFMRTCNELGSKCAASHQLLTISGIREVTEANRVVQSFRASHPSEVLRFLQLLCEGHNLEMQEFLRAQGKTSIDMVTCAADFVTACSRYMNPCSIEFGMQCVDTLIELVQKPCYRNQRLLVDTQLPHVLNQFLQLSPDLPVDDDDVGDLDEYQKAISGLKNKSVTLLLSLLERAQDRFIPSRILKALEMQKIFDILNGLRKKYLYLQEEEGDDGWEEEEDDSSGCMVADEAMAENPDFVVACSLFMLIKMLQYFDDNLVDGLSTKCNSNYIRDIARLQANCGFIEICRDKRLERIFFQIPPLCRYLSRASRKALLREVERGNHQDQMLDFVNRAQGLFEDMQHLANLNTSLIYQGFLRISMHLDKAFFWNACLFNGIAIYAFGYIDSQYGTLETPANIIIDGQWDAFLIFLAVFQLLISVVRLGGYYFEAGLLRVNRILTEPHYYVVATELYGGPRYYLVFTRILLSDGYFLLLCFYVVSTVVALVFRQQTNRLSMFLLMLHLADMFSLSDALGNVILSVSSRFSTLYQTTILAFIMMYIYAAIGFVLFAEYYSFESAELEGGDEKDFNINSARCDTIWKCFLVTVDMGLRKGDIGTALEDISWRDIIPGTFVEECDSPPGLEYMGCLGIGGNDAGPFIMLRIIYTSTFFVLIKSILINVLFGVIIDTFGELREQAQEKQERMENECFICGLERYKFEINSTDGNGFAQHIQDDHNIWTYLYFIVYLRMKPVEEQTGFESYVFNKLNEIGKDGATPKQTPDVSWFPCNQAMAIAEEGNVKSEVLGARLDKVADEVKAFSNAAIAHMQTVQHSMEREEAEDTEQLAQIDEEHSSDEGEDWATPTSRPASARHLSRRLSARADLGGEAAAVVTQGVTAALRGFAQLTNAAVGREAPMPPPQTPRTLYNDQLSTLADQGFDNMDINLQLLRRHEGDVDAVLSDLHDEPVRSSRARGGEAGEAEAPVADGRVALPEAAVPVALLGAVPLVPATDPPPAPRNWI